VQQEERDAILRQQVVLPETPRRRRELAALEDELRSSPLRGRKLPLRLRNFASSAEAYLAATGGPLPYMLRLHEIERLTEEHQGALDEAWERIADECAGDGREFSREWAAVVARWSFDEVNDLIARHNRWYPAESRLPMDPRTGDFSLVNGRSYRLAPLDSTWALEQFPAELSPAPAVAP
jgi:hypothetical protein